MEGNRISLKKAASVLFAVVICIFNLNVRDKAYSGGGAEKPLSEVVNEMAVLINEAREELGLKPLYVVNYLNDVANTRARELITTYDAIAASKQHIRPNGEPWYTIIDTGLVAYQWAGENIACGSVNAEKVFDAWKKSPTHWEILTNPNTTHMGIGLCYEENSPRKWYWSNIFVDLFEGKAVPDYYMPQKYPVKPACIGDVTGDGIIDSFDLVLLYQYLNDEAYFNDLQKEAADLLKDGNITSADAAVLKKYILGDYKTLPVTIDMLMGG